MPSAASPTAVSPRIATGRFRRATEVVGTTAADAMVLLDVERGRYYTLNEVGGRVWTMLDEGLRFPVIVERLTQEFDAPRGRIEADVAALLERLLAAGLVKLEPAR